MAIKQRSVLSTQNTTLSTNKDTAFPDNNNKEITAADLRTWLNELLSQIQDILDSYFNKLDELRITSTLNYDIVATPTDWNGGTAPATQNLVNDELASRTKILENSISTNPSNDIAYVSDGGSDTVGLFEIGNPLKPFATIQAAIDALPNNNSTVYVLGGTYTESTGLAYLINMEIKNNINIILKGVTINGSIRLANCNNCFVDLSGSVVNSNLTYGLVVVTSSNCAINLEAGKINGRVDLSLSGSINGSIKGGEIISTTGSALTIGEGAFVDSVYINSISSGNTVGGLTIRSSTNILKKPIVTNCRIEESTNYAVHGNGILQNCVIIALAGFRSDSSVLIPELYDCRIEATGSGNHCVAGESKTKGKFKNCTLISENNNVRMFGNCEDLNFENCTFIAEKDCLEISATITRSGDDTILQNCSFFPAQTNVLGVVLNDSGGYGSDTGVFRFIRNTYSKVWSTTDALRAIDYNSTTIVGLLPPPIN